MSRTAAKITQADINRAIRAARAAGADVKVRFDRDGATIEFTQLPDKPEEPESGVVL